MDILSNQPKQTIKAEITWEDRNYCCGYVDEQGVVVATDKTLEGVKQRFEEALRDYLESEDFNVEYVLAVSALLKQAERFTTMSVLSRFTGINRQLLSHYIHSVKKPREAQRQRIIKGLHEIGQQFLAVQ